MSHRVAFVPVANDRDYASARLRVFLPIEALRAHGCDAELLDLSADPLRAGARRHDVVVFSKLYGERERELTTRLRAAGTRVVLDLCDNHFYVPDDAPELAARAGRLRRMVAEVDAVSVSTPALAEVVARERPDVRVTVIDDALDPMVPPLLQRLRLPFRKRLRVPKGALRVVWFGHHGERAPAFGLVDLVARLPELDAVHARVPLALTVITASKERYREQIKGQTTFPTTFHRWNRVTFRHLHRQHDVCVIPIRDNPFTRCKSANRVVLSLLHGVPVIADRIPSYQEFEPYVRFGDFAANLAAIAADPAPMARATAAGREHVLRRFTREHLARQWSALFDEVAEARERGAAARAGA